MFVQCSSHRRKFVGAELLCRGVGPVRKRMIDSVNTSILRIYHTDFNNRDIGPLQNNVN